MNADTVRLDTLPDDDLSELLQWYPRPAPGQTTRRELLLAAARNRFPDGRVPIEPMEEAS